MPSKAEILRPYVESVVREYLEIPEGGELKKDDDGDIPIRWGSAVYYVRLVDRDPVLPLHSRDGLGRLLGIASERHEVG